MKTILIAATLIITNCLSAQKKIPQNWQLLDPKADHVYGMGVEEAYKLLKGKTAKTVIVAVIDSGVEIDHEDLKDVIWTNLNEIPDNGIDDDKNGYIDDVHGWSFLGGKNGDINYEALEVARMYHQMNKKFYGSDTIILTPNDKKEFLEFQKIKSDFLEEQEKNEQQLNTLKMLSDFLENVKKQNNDVLSKKTLKKYSPDNSVEIKIKKRLKLLFAFGLSPEDLDQQIAESRKAIENTIKYNNMNADSIRQYTVGDDPNNMKEHYYGCNRVEGPDALHGTHVAGIIAAIRNNNVGMNGVASNVKIMPVRAVPNGDERDKDIANAIYYAVDNGATVINMSFGKYYSPDKKLVDDAVEYAASKDVLLVHAAGNESKNSDIELSFPNRDLLSGKVADNWIQVGANEYKSGKKIIAPFSNYGSKNIDFFAPGVDIYSTVTDNKYAKESGTSMASPATAGVAALIRGYFPELKASEVRDVLMKSVVTYKKRVKVPGTKKDKKKLDELCISGGFVNANNAVAELLRKKK
jgi:subtilisin family serine protease